MHVNSTLQDASLEYTLLCVIESPRWFEIIATSDTLTATRPGGIRLRN